MWRIQWAIDHVSTITGCQDICDFVNFGVSKIFETPKLVLKGNTSLAHIINLAAQEALKSLKAISNISNDELLDEERNNNRQFKEVSGLLHKVNNLFLNNNNI